MSPPFVIMIAGPNGSGKTTLTRYLMSDGTDFGDYINPDDIATTLQGDYAARVQQAQREADRRRDACLNEQRSFSFETVMSHPSKLDVLREARKRGFETIMYFVGLEDPSHNVARVKLRVEAGGHAVPADRIVARYHRTMAALIDAVRLVDRAYIFDGTATTELSSAPRLCVETRKLGGEWQIHALPMPKWIKINLLSKLNV